MSFSIPSGMAGTIAAFLQGAGDVVVFTAQAGGPSLTLTGSVQRPSETTFVQDASQEGFVVFLAGDAFGAITPQRFDRLAIRGEDRSIDEALPIEAGGMILAWQLRVLG